MTATVRPAPASALAIQDEGTPQGTATTLNFEGAGVSVAVVGDTATATIPGGGGGLPSGGTVGQVVTNTAPGAGDWEDVPSGVLTSEQFTGDGSEDTFTLSQTPTSAYAIVTVNGAQVTTYTITGSDVVFDTPPALAAEVVVNYVYAGGVVSGSPFTLVDLGIVNVVDLLAGPVTIYDIPANSIFVPVMGAEADFVVFDGGSGRLDISEGSFDPDGTLVKPPQNPWTNLGELEISAGASFATVRSSLITNYGQAGLSASIRYGDLWRAWYLPGDDGFPFLSAPAAWQANHVYAQYTTIHGPDDHFWAATTAGTSDGSIPDFAANEDATVVDSTVTWTDEGVIPTVGSIHLWAIVGRLA
jgi:hypothetical protein